MTTFWDIKKDPYNEINDVLSSGCPLIDSKIGGYPVGSVTEISGEAGCGKTQMCLCLSLQIQLQKSQGGLDGKTAYLSCGEGEFPIRRLSQLSDSFLSRASSHLHNTITSKEQLLDGVKIEQCHSVDQLKESLKDRIPELCRSGSSCSSSSNINKHHNDNNRNRVKLLIIDSIAGLFRTDFDTNQSMDRIIRAQTMHEVLQLLKWLSQCYQIVVVVVNQVTASIVGSASESMGLATNIDGKSGNMLGSEPALGINWAFGVNTRIMLSRDSQAIRSLNNVNRTNHVNLIDDHHETNENMANQHQQLHSLHNGNNDQGSDTRKHVNSTISSSSVYAMKSSNRKLSLLWSPWTAPSVISYDINSGGVFGINDSINMMGNIS